MMDLDVKPELVTDPTENNPGKDPRLRTCKTKDCNPTKTNIDGQDIEIIEMQGAMPHQNRFDPSSSPMASAPPGMRFLRAFPHPLQRACNLSVEDYSRATPSESRVLSVVSQLCFYVGWSIKSDTNLQFFLPASWRTACWAECSLNSYQR